MAARLVGLALVFGIVWPVMAPAQPLGAWQAQAASDGYYGLQPGRAASAAQCGGVANACALNIPLLEKATAGIDWRLVGRLGAAPSRPLRPMIGAPEGGEGLAYGFGLSWDLSPNASASFGFESYDYRFGSGDREPVRATSLGLQWRY